MNRASEKFDEIVGKMIREDSLEKTPDNLSNRIMNKITGEKALPEAIKKPILNKWGKLLIVVVYVLILIPLLFSDTSGTAINLFKDYTINLKPIQLPNLGDGFNKIFLMVTVAGWFFVFLDNYLKKIIFR